MTHPRPFRRALPLLLALVSGLGVAGCSDNEAVPVPGTPTAAPTSGAAPAPGQGACALLTDDQVSEAAGQQLTGRPEGADVCSWAAPGVDGLAPVLTVAAATQAQFDEERAINSADSDVPPPSLGLGDDAYFIAGSAGGFGSAGVLVGSRKAVLSVDGSVPADRQRSALEQLLTLVAPQLADG